MRFQGVIDPYHSDVLVNDSATTRWLPTVGYGNNSTNIGYESVAEGRPGLGTWCFGLALAAVFFSAMSLAY